MTKISKNVYIDILDDIANKYNNTYHTKIQMKPVDDKDNTYIDFLKKLMIKILNLKLVIIEKFQNTKTSLLNDTHQIRQKKIL